MEIIRTNRVHRVRRQLEHTIKDECATLEEHVTPIPAVILDDIMRLGLDPQIEPNQCEAPNPSEDEIVNSQDGTEVGLLPHHMYCI